MIITKIEAQSRDPERVNIYADGKFWIGISRITCYRMGLVEGMRLGQSLIDKMGTAEGGEMAWNHALRLIGLSPKSASRLKLQLARKFGSNQATATVARLKTEGLLDDQALALQLVRQAGLSQTKSRLEILALLKSRMLPESVSQEAIAQLPADHDELAATKLLSQKLVGKAATRELQIKAGQYLARKGFAYSAIRSAMANLGADPE